MKIIEKYIKIYYLLLYLTILSQSIFLIYTISTTESIFITRHYLGLVSVFTLGLLFIYNFNLGRVITGFILLIGLWGGLVLTPEVETIFLSFNIGSLPIPIFYGQPMFFLWLLLHLVASYKIYFGISTKEYWQKLMSER